MDFARQSAPTDGKDLKPNGYGQDVWTTSKQNSDAKGLFYQWGRKDPFTFAISSDSYGTYPVKIYTIDGVLIYQDSRGESNKDKQPEGGVIYSSIIATSMMETIKKPITFYRVGAVINQSGHTNNLWSYYWTSHSRGTDGEYNNKYLHNRYLDGYNQHRSKSIYDPCPYGYRVPSNGTYNGFSNYSKWILYSYIGGLSWISDDDLSFWFCALGNRRYDANNFSSVGAYGSIWTSSQSDTQRSYMIEIRTSAVLINYKWPLSQGNSVRCIEVSPPRLTDVESLLIQQVKVSIQVSKTVMLMGCYINGDIKTRSLLLQVVRNGAGPILK